MRIAHIIWGLGTGGAETMLVDIVSEQVKANKVMIIAINEILDEQLVSGISSDCNIVFLNRKIGSKDPLPWVKLNTKLWVFRPDIIHCHLEGFRKMIVHPAPKVFTIHNITTSGKEYSKFAALYAISDAVKKFTASQGYNAIVVHNGIHPELISPKTFFDKTDICKIVCVGRLLNQHKGQDILVKAANIILNQRKCTKFHIDFIGDGPSRQELEQMIAECGLSNHMTLLGQRDRTYIYSHLMDYDLYVMPSRFEGFGLTVVEAMSAKIPVLVCDLDGPMEVIDYGKCGQYFKTGDAESLANELLRFFENGVSVDVVNRAFNYVNTHFDVKITARRYIEEYKKQLYENSTS